MINNFSFKVFEKKIQSEIKYLFLEFQEEFQFSSFLKYFFILEIKIILKELTYK
jgi:hypothetical protein